jgi:glucokinase
MFIGVEIGGTKLQLGLGAGDGVLKALWRETVDVQDGPEGIRKQIARAVLELLDRAKVEQSSVRGIGIGFGGPVDDSTKSIIKSHQIEGWDGFPLAAWISTLVGLPTVLGNDADVAGLAEALVGAGRGVSPVFYVTVGSGIGGGFVINGEIYRGTGRGAAEIGHLKIVRLKEGNREEKPLEEYASGWAIAASARQAIEEGQGAGSLLQRYLEEKSGNLTAQDVGIAANQGDSLASSILEQAIGALASALCHVIALLCPRRIIIGGGVSLLGEKLFFERLRQEVSEREFKPFASCYDIVPAALGEEVVVHGAIALAGQKLRGGS